MSMTVLSETIEVYKLRNIKYGPLKACESKQMPTQKNVVINLPAFLPRRVFLKNIQITLKNIRRIDFW